MPKRPPSSNGLRRTALAAIPLSLLILGSCLAYYQLILPRSQRTRVSELVRQLEPESLAEREAKFQLLENEGEASFVLSQVKLQLRRLDDPCAEKNQKLIHVEELGRDLADFTPESPFPTDNPESPQSPPSPDLDGCSLTLINRTGMPIRLWRFVPRQCELRLMSSVNDVGAIPTTGKNLMIVAVVDNVIHFRIFDDEGRKVIDTDEKMLKTLAPRLTELAQQIEDLRKQLQSLRSSPELTVREQIRVFAAVTSITGYGEWRETISGCGPVAPRLSATGGWAYVLIEKLEESVQIARDTMRSPGGKKPPFVPNVYEPGWFYFPYGKEAKVEIKVQFFDDPRDPRNFAVTPP